MDKFGSTIWNSSDVDVSLYVANSTKISNSRHVFSSDDVNDSTQVVGSESVSDSIQIFASSMVEESMRVYNSENISKSDNVCNSLTIAEGKNIWNSAHCFSCSELVRGMRLEDCHFCVDCADSKNLMFCKGLNGAEYCIFNTPVGQKQYELFARQYTKFMTVDFAFAQYWPNFTAIAEMPSIRHNFGKWFEGFDDKIWKWVRTLPNYNPLFMYEFTMNKKFLEEF